MKKSTKVWLSLAAAFPLLGLIGDPPQFMLLIITFFFAAWFLRSRVERFWRRIKLPLYVKFWIATVLAGYLGECLAWGGSFVAASEEPALLHPQLIPDLILATGFYSGWAVAWLIVLRLGPGSLKGVFITAGILGIFFEQMGAVFASLAIGFLSNPLVSIGMAAFLFGVYGSIMGLGYLPFAREFSELPMRKPQLRYPVAFVLMFLCAALLTYAAGIAATPLGLIPPKQPIDTHPFW